MLKKKEIVGVTLISVVAVVLSATGCVRRTMTITTDPPQAFVYLNGQEVGKSTITTDFTFYGDYNVTIRKQGYETLKTNWQIDPPWYQVVPFDFFAEVLWPGMIHDEHQRHFILSPLQEKSVEELAERANEMKAQLNPMNR